MLLLLTPYSCRDHLLHLLEAKGSNSGISVQIGAVCGSLVLYPSPPPSHTRIAAQPPLHALVQDMSEFHGGLPRERSTATLYGNLQ